MAPNRVALSSNGELPAGRLAQPTTESDKEDKGCRPTTNDQHWADDWRLATDDCFTISVPPHDSPSEPCHHSGTHPGARLDAGGVRQNPAIARRARAHAHRTRHLQRDVERALLV